MITGLQSVATDITKRLSMANGYSQGFFLDYTYATDGFSDTLGVVDTGYCQCSGGALVPDYGDSSGFLNSRQFENPGHFIELTPQEFFSCGVMHLSRWT